jgi:hypothetical protein
VSPARPPHFDPRSILAFLQAAEVQSVVIGGLARVARGSDEVSDGVDICPALQPANLARLDAALSAMGAGGDAPIDETRLRAEPVIEVMTAVGELKIVAAPAGVPRGYEALRPGASTEHLGDGLQPTIASTGDLIAMSAALRRPEDLERLPALRRILELEAEPARLVAVKPPVKLPRSLAPGEADKLPRPARGRSAPARGRSIDR